MTLSRFSTQVTCATVSTIAVVFLYNPGVRMTHGCMRVRLYETAPYCIGMTPALTE
jgi:hypothetical protein